MSNNTGDTFDPFALGGIGDPIIEMIADEQRAWILACAERNIAETACLAAGLSWLQTEEEDDPLFRETLRLEDAAVELTRRVRETRPTTLLGAVAKLEWADNDRETVNAVIADLRKLAA